MQYKKFNEADYRNEIITDLKDGKESIDPYVKKLILSDFVFNGYMSESVMNEQLYSYRLLKSKDEKIYGLEIAAIDEEEYEVLSERVVAILENPKTDDENIIIQDLISKYWHDGGNNIGEISSMGDFNLTLLINEYGILC